MPDPKQPLRERDAVLQVRARLRGFDRERAAWLLAALTFVLGDVASTAFGLHIGLSEAHPVAALVLNHGNLAAMLVVKITYTAAVYTVSTRLLPPIPERIAIPLSLAAVGVAITAYNMWAILSVI